MLLLRDMSTFLVVKLSHTRLALQDCATSLFTDMTTDEKRARYVCTQFPAKTVPKGLHYKHLRPYL